MLNEAHYSAVLNFFYFMLLDEGMALSAAYKTVKLAQKRARKIKNTEIDAVLIHTMSDVLRRYRKKRPPAAIQPPRSEWKTPDLESLGAWKDYMRRGDDESSETLVLRYILNFPITAISKGLEIPEGTVLYRLERGLEGFAEGPQNAGTAARR